MMPMLYDRFIRIGKVAGAITLLFGVPYGIFEYIENQHAKRIEHTLEFYRTFNTSPFSGYRERITDVLINNKDYIEAASKNEKELEEAIVNILEKSGSEKDLFLLLDFYDGLLVCILKTLCDPDTTERLFANRALEVYMNFYQYIQRLRATSASRGFGVGLETIAKTRRASPQ